MSVVLRPDGFDFLEPLDLDRVIYSFHMYRPHSFTHQGISNNRVGISYPGRVDGQFWDKEALREAMRQPESYLPSPRLRLEAATQVLP